MSAEHAIGWLGRRGRPWLGPGPRIIMAAARRAQADEFIRQLPEGYQSLVGERGGHLSVGQRQRIGIARAFLKNAPILLLDDVSSELDAARTDFLFQHLAILNSSTGLLNNSPAKKSVNFFRKCQ